MSLKVAVCQFHIEWEDKQKNYSHSQKFVEEASREKADIILFPEMSFTGFSMDIEKTMEEHEETVGVMSDMATTYSIAIGFGWVKGCSGMAENHYSIIDRTGTLLIDYVKIHSFGYGGEGEQFVEGSDICMTSFGEFTLAPFICYDLRFPEIFQSASTSAEVLIVPANWPQSRRAHWKCLLQARAIENQAYVIGINCVGEAGELFYSGDSCIITPNGDVEQIVANKEAIIYSTLEKDKLSIRDTFPVKKDRKEDLYYKFYSERGL